MTTELEKQWREDVTTQLKDLTKAQNTTAVALERIESRVIPRQEFEAAIGTRVSTEAFDGRMAAVETRIQRLEGGPGAFRAWLATGLGIFGSLMSIGGCMMQLIGAFIAIAAGVALPIIFFIVLHK